MIKSKPSRSQEVEAVQWRGDNLEEVQAFLAKYGYLIERMPDSFPSMLYIDGADEYPETGDWIVVDPVDSFIMACPKEPEFASRFEPVPDLIRTIEDYEGLPGGTILEGKYQDDLHWDEPIAIHKRGGEFHLAGYYGSFNSAYIAERYVCSVVRLGGSQ